MKMTTCGAMLRWNKGTVRMKPGSLYRPANGIEGEGFMDEWCGNCTFSARRHGSDGCQLPALAMLHDVYEHEYPHQWRYDNDGVPMCAAFNRKPTTEMEAEYLEAML
jgi:hypothetical protein